MLTNFEESATTTGRPFGQQQQGRQGGGGGANALLDTLHKTDAFNGLTRNKEDLADKARDLTARGEVAKHQTRTWQDGDVYAPHDLSWVEMHKWKQPKRPSKDIVDVLGLNPLDHYKVRCV